MNQAGSYWYHSHLDGQYPDGFRGPLIVQDPESPYIDKYDEELVITLSDWYHDEMPGLIKKFLSVTNPTGAEPVPNSALMNDTQNLQIQVEPGKTYLMRFINMAAFAAQYVWIEGHTFRIVEVDGVWTEEAEADLIYVSAAQRYSVLLTARNDTSTNFAINGAMDADLFDRFPEGLNANVTSFLVYDPSAPMPTPSLVDEYSEFDDHTLVPYDREPLLENPDYSFKLDVKMDNLGDGVNYAFMNDITYVRPKVPSLFTALTTGAEASNPAIYGINTNTFVLQHNQIIEIILNNHDPGKHPFHLHGHNFQCVVRGEENTNDYNPENATLPEIPMKRDTWVVRPNGHIVMRFRADNPGAWLFHCHIEWHVDSGLTVTFIEVRMSHFPSIPVYHNTDPLWYQAPLVLQSSLSIPVDHYAACNAANAYPKFQTQGNAAGRTTDLLNLEGAHVSPAPLPEGFTARGIVALVFSILAALLGLAAVAWYGVGELAQTEQASVVVTVGVVGEK